MDCLFCGDLEKNYKPDPGNDFICSLCVQLFTGVSQKELKRAYDKANDKGLTDKARAIESFLIPEDKINGQRKPISKKRGRHTHRKRIDRTIGDKKKRIGRSTVSAPTAVL